MGLNGGIHDGFEVTAGSIEVTRNGVSLDRIALSDRRRGPIAAEQILVQSHANRARMRERDDAKRREFLAGL